MMAYISRLSLITKTINEFPNAIIITERCLNTDRYVFAKMLYDSGKMEDVEYQIYIKWFDNFNYIINNTKTIYLNTLPNVCFIRINKRNREGESNISLEYLENCNKYHNDMIDNIDKNKLLTIDGNIDTENNTNIYNLWCESIKNFIYNKL
jgi:deoxycitidine kinase/deoxyguanosine kinase